MNTRGTSGRTAIMLRAFGLASCGLACNLSACRCSPQPSPTPAASPSPPLKRETPTSPVQRVEVAEVIYEQGLRNGWQDWGWSNRQLDAAGPALVNFENWGGWIIAKPGLSGDFGGLRMRIRPRADKKDFLDVSLWSNDAKLPPVRISEVEQKQLNGGWVEILVPFSRLNPDNQPFDRIVLHAAENVGPEMTAIDGIALTKPLPIAERATKAPSATVSIEVDCQASATQISPYIYGFAYYPYNDAKMQEAQWLFGGTVRRWGGSVTSTYNWEVGAWNSGSDYFFENHQFSHQVYLKENSEHQVANALTVPIMGWVSKDTTSVSFPVSVYGPQESTDQWKPDAGNGKDRNGKELRVRDPSRSHRPITPDFVRRWIETVRNSAGTNAASPIWMYILDNEPMIWNLTHRDAHPEPPTYDELVQRTIDYGTVVRKADPNALIAGPAEWGWMGYMYSGKDLAAGGPSARPDRKAHGDLPVVAYYLKALAEHERKTGTRILDVLDLHGYPYADGVHSARTDAATNALRIRSTRMLWDETYVDESWVKEPVRLLPRMHEWIDKYYPGRGISIGEWNFGGESHMSGALAIAETLGRYAQFGVKSAFYWTYPPAASPAMWAFRAFRDYDGKHSGFQDWLVPSRIKSSQPAQVSAFVSRNAAGDHWVAIVLNFSPKEALLGQLKSQQCTPRAMQAWTYAGGSKGFERTAATDIDDPQAVLPPYSITIFDLKAGKSATSPH